MSLQVSADDGWATPLIVAVAPNGARRTRSDHPALPITPDELAATAHACLEAGACMIHLHVRDSAARHSLDATAYREAIRAVERSVGNALVIQATSEAVGLYAPEEQMQMVRSVRPESVSLALRELVPDENHERRAAEFLVWVQREKIIPQYILYTPRELARFEDLWRRGVIPDERPFVLFVLGRHSKDQTSNPADLLPFVHGQPSGLHWAVCAFGVRECACVLTGAALGGHVRVGFENNLQLSDGSTAADNAALVRQVALGASVLGRPLADAVTLRTLLLR